MRRHRHDADEDSVRVRPGKGSRPRGRRRPTHSSAETGLVVAVDRGRYTVDIGGAAVNTMLSRELGRAGVVVGDRVGVVGDTSGGKGTLARIVRVDERESQLRRTADDTDDTERVIVANADQLVIVVALADPPPRTGLIDRCLVAAYDAEVEPVLCLTKADLPDASDALERLREYYRDIELPQVVCRYDEPPRQLREMLTDQVSVLFGHSGVGKSTLVNALVPEAARATGVVSGVGKGRHTSTSAVALRLDGGGWVVDTPGIRSFGLAHIPADELLDGFPDLLPGSTSCPSNCGHTEAEPECGVSAWVTAGHASRPRLASFRNLLASRSSVDQ